MTEDSELLSLKDEISSLRTRLAQCQYQLSILTRDENSLHTRCARLSHDLPMMQDILETSTAVVFRRSAGTNPSLLYVSSNVDQWGYSADELLSGTILFRDIVHPEDHERIKAEIQTYSSQDIEEYTQEYRILTRDGKTRWISDHTSILYDDKGEKEFHQGIVMDTTELKKAQIELKRSEEKFRRTIESTHQGFLFMDEDFIIQDTNDAYCRLVGHARETVLGRSPMDFATPEFRQFLTTRKKQFLSSDYRTFEGRLLHKDGHAIPVLIHGNTVRDDAGRILGNVAIVTDLSEQKKALQLASEVQKSLLPRQSPNIPGFDIAGISISSDEIGGDYYDFLDRPGCRDNTVGSVVGDIAGHGVDAALLMTTARAFMRMRATKPGGLSDILYDLNNHLVDDLYGSGRFMTMFSLAIDAGAGAIHWVKAGHDPALLYSPDDRSFTELGGHDLPLGVIRDTTFEEFSMKGPATGQVLVLATDGIWESFNLQGDMFGRDRFRRIIADSACKPAAQIIDDVVSAVLDFSSGLRPEDDITLVVIKKL